MKVLLLDVLKVEVWMLQLHGLGYGGGGGGMLDIVDGCFAQIC